jgi:ATP-dependent Clp protease ATP-binding subunit ClpA
MYPFERFTERAKKVLTLAQEEAERAHRSYIGTEHLLLGLLREEESLAAKALANLGVEINEVRAVIASVIGRSEQILIRQRIPTSRVKEVIELSFEEARKMGNNYVGTEHLLLGLLVEGEGIAAHVLQDLGATLAKVRPEIDQLLRSGGVTESKSVEPGRPITTPAKYPIDRFTSAAKNVLTLAQEEAERAQHSYIGTEHLLLGLLRQGEGLAAAALANLGVESNFVRGTLMSAIGRNEPIVIRRIIPTSRVKRVIEIAFEEARKIGNNYVGTEHLLLGLLVEGQGIAAHVLEDLGATLEKVRSEIDRLGRSGVSEGPPDP